MIEITSISTNAVYKVFGTVRGKFQQPLAFALVRVFDKDIRSEQFLNETRTNEYGHYEVIYVQQQFAYTDKKAADIVVRVYDENEALLGESQVYYNAGCELHVDLNLSGKDYKGISEFERMALRITPYTGRLPLPSLTETNETKDITFLTNKTNLPQDRIEMFGMSFRFAQMTHIEPVVFYGLMRENVPGNILNNLVSTLVDDSYESKLALTFDGIMHESIDVLMNALNKALEDNIVPFTLSADLERIKKELMEQLQVYSRSHPVTNSPTGLFQRIRLAGLSQEQETSFSEFYKKFSGSENDFWKSLQQTAGLSDKAGDLQTAFELFNLTDQSVLLSSYLIQTQGVRNPNDLSSFTKYSTADWEEMIKKTQAVKQNGIPQDEKIKTFASKLEKNFAKRFPTQAFFSKLQRDEKTTVTNKDQVLETLQSQPEFDLLHTRIGKSTQDDKDGKAAEHLRKVQRIFKLAPTYEATNTLLADNIHSASHIYRMGKDNFINKYTDKLGKKEAKDIFQKATQVHSQALALAGNMKSLAEAGNLNVFPDYKKALMKLNVEVPSLETLFGNSDLCECDECRSVYGAAAYLADILHFLEFRNSDIAGISVKDLLVYRRTDIANIDLTCDNTNTLVPYIDIACELMEEYIQSSKVTLNISFAASLAKGVIDPSLYTEITNQFTASGFGYISNLLTKDAQVSDPYNANRYDGVNLVTEKHWIIRDKLVSLKATETATGVEVLLLHQTLLSADEVSANPEYVNVPVYDLLKKQQRPFTLPFDLFETEGELYLEKLGINKSDLITTFRKEHDVSGPPTDGDLNVTYAYLNVNETERQLIFVEDLVNQTNYWGTLAAGTSVAVNDFEKASGLDYDQILSLLDLTFINPAKDIVIQHDDLSCNTDTQQIINLDGGKLDRMHRFIRLWRKTSLTMEELDAIIMSGAIGNGKIDINLANELKYFLQLQSQWQLSAFQMLVLYQNLNTTSSDNLYNQLFQNRYITSPLNPDFAIANVSPGSLNISADRKAVIIAATGLMPEDLDLLISKTDGILSLDNLSFIYRHNLLAQALSISIGDLFVVQDIINITPGVFDQPSSTYFFTQKFKTFIQSGFSVDEINYVLRHQNDAGGSLIASESHIANALSPVQSNLLKIRAITTPVADPQGSLLGKWLADPLLNWDASFVIKLMDILNTSDNDEYHDKINDATNFLMNLRVRFAAPSFATDLGVLPAITFPDSLASQISYDNSNKQLKFVGFMSATDQGNLLGLSGDGAYQTAVNNLFAASQQTDNSAANIFFNSIADINTLKAITFLHVADRFTYFLNVISPVYTELQQTNALAGQLTSWFTIDDSVSQQLLISIPDIYSFYTDNNFVNKLSDLTATNYPNQFNLYLRLQKICFIINKLKLSAPDIAWQLIHANDVDSLDYLSLPLTPVAGTVTTYDSFEMLINILKFEQYHPETIISVYDILQDAIESKTIGDIETDLVKLTGWKADDLKKLVEAPNYLNIQAPVDFKSATILMRLHQCFVTLAQLNTNADDAINWCANSLTKENADKIKQTLKARYSDDDWLTVTQPLQDKLREEKRDALIAYLLANQGTESWETDADLYSYFLLDVEMSACQPTSRIVQATNSVQLFAQRCFLKLENNITVDSKLDSDWTQWEWMKYFRLWQANYKVFLYPENWIEPDLLPDKSSFFTDLQNDLLQNEVTQTNVEDAFMTYLEKLDAVARLEVKGMWYDDPGKTLYVFARTYGGDPKIYYFRKLVEDRRWTPWEKIELDIVSDHIIPVVYNNRVYLFWALFTEHSEAQDSIPVPDINQSSFTISKPIKSWQIQLAYSEYKNGKWTPRKVSNTDATGTITASEDYYPLKENFLFSALDIPQIDFQSIIRDYEENRDTKALISEIQKAIEDALTQNGNLIINCYYQQQYQDLDNSNSTVYYQYVDSFELDPCRGYPAVVYDPVLIKPWLFDRSLLQNMLDDESGSYPNNALSLASNSILNQTPGTFRNLIPLQMGFFDRLINILYQFSHPAYVASFREQRSVASVGTFMPYFYQDQGKTYYVRPELTDDGNFEFLYSDFEKLFFAIIEQNQAELQEILASIPKNSKFFIMHHYFNFYHPLVCYFMRKLFTDGIDGLMTRDVQLKNDVAYDSSIAKFDFNKYYEPTMVVYNDALNPVTYPNGVVDANPGYPKDDVDFNLHSGYGLYNWELFYHAPLMIAEQLDQNQQFEDAEKWYHYIFNPTDTSAYPSPDKFWITKPFFINADNKYVIQKIENILLGVDTADQTLVADVTDWRNNPFQPHYIAEYRTVAYQKTAVMKYLDHLVAWADYLFTQDTMETVNEATQMYLLASQILGPKPQIIPPSYEQPVDNYDQLRQKIDALSDAMVEIENLMPLQKIKNYDGVIPQQQNLPTLQTLYFCLPMNDKLLGYWDTIADRLYKIRHCLNIEGVFAPLALFAPPIDPGLLVRATAAGLDIGSILNDLNSPLPFYRFSIMMQKATELTNEVKSLGAALLSALEKKDAEAISLLRSSQEIKVLKAVLDVKKKQVEDAQASLDNLEKQKELITLRRDYYNGLITNGLNTSESVALDLTAAAIDMDQAAVVTEFLANALAMIPDFNAGASGFGGSPHVAVKFGGEQLGNALRAMGSAIRGEAGIMHSMAGVSTTRAGYERRKDDWKQQLTLATKELEQIDKQILGAEIKLDITNKEVANQELQIENAKAVDDLMHSKFTNIDLFNWMITQISTVYFKAYNLAYSTAKKVEQCFRYELGLSDSAYINFGYWSSLKKGLLAGEQLMYDLKKLELAYYEQNKREYELTKHISLAQLDGAALLKLKTTGDCWINLPEEVFDMDYPGHYMRRIKSVSLTIPCIAGPYTTVSCTLTLNKNSVRTKSEASGTYTRKALPNGVPTDDPRFRDALGTIQSIVTSTAQNDSGMFEVNFKDERYLPFEGAGAISLWHMQLSSAVRQFDYNTISDVIMHVRYTAREGGDELKASATSNVNNVLHNATILVSQKDKGLVRLFSARNEFPTEWYAFLNPPAAADDQLLSLMLTSDRFPFFASIKNIKINAVEVIADNTLDTSVTSINNVQVLSPANSITHNLGVGAYGPYPGATYNFSNQATGSWKIVNSHTNPRVSKDKIRDLVLIVHYTIQ